MKIFVDDVRKAPDGYVWCKSVNEAIDTLKFCLYGYEPIRIEVLDLDHDSGDYYKYGGDYIRILDWIEQEEYETGNKLNIPIHIHSMNPIGIENIRRIIHTNGWIEV